jgi:hypothetical protein
MSVAAKFRGQQRRNTWGSSWTQIFIKAIDYKKEMPTSAVSTIGGSLPQCPEGVQVRNWRFFLEEIGQLRDNRRKEVVAVSIRFSA